MECKKKSCHCKKSVVLDYNELKSIKYEFGVQPTNSGPFKHSTPDLGANTLYRQDIQRKTIKQLKDDSEPEKLIRINHETLERLIRNTNFNLIQKNTARDNYEMLKGPIEPLLLGSPPILRRKKSIKALHDPKDRRMFKAIETVLSNTRSLPRIVVTRNS